LEEYEQGPPACRVASILSKTAGARGETQSFFNGLIYCLHRRVKTGFCFSPHAAAGSGIGSNLDTPRPIGFGRAGFSNVVLPGVSDRPWCLEVRFWVGRWV
jgi:hypothetical protein